MIKLWEWVKDLFACLFALLLIGVTILVGLFTVLCTIWTISEWSTTTIGNKLEMFGLIALTLFLIGWMGTALNSKRFDNLPKSTKGMSGLDYEMYCGKYLLTHGFHDVRTTPPSGDYGADLVAKDANGVTWVFQCKHYKSKVGNSCVQEVVAAKKHYGAEKAAVMTNSQLTEKARELAIENEVLLFELLCD